MANGKADEFIKELSRTLLPRYQTGLETSMRGSDFIFDCAHLLYCIYHRKDFKQGRSYIDSLDWIKQNKNK